MAILIKGMTMPADGRYMVCVTHDSDGGVHWVFQNQDTLEFLKHGEITEIREQHGDLIDRDALLEGEGRYFISLGKEGIDVTEILRAKTIIPSSEEG